MQLRPYGGLPRGLGELHGFVDHRQASSKEKAVRLDGLILFPRIDQKVVLFLIKATDKQSFGRPYLGLLRMFIRILMYQINSGGC